MDFLARPTPGSWPVIWASSALAVSRSLTFWMASPTPTLTMIFSRRGTAMIFVMPSSSWSAGITSFRYFSNKRLMGGSSLLPFDHRLAAVAEPGLAAVLEAPGPGADPLPALRAVEHDVGYGDRGLFLHDAALLVPAAVGLDEVLGKIDPFDDDPVGLGDELQDLALLALVLAPDDDDEVVLLEGDLGHQRTSGAREMILVNFRSRSSRPTGPKTRVPTGSPVLSMM